MVMDQVIFIYSTINHDIGHRILLNFEGFLEKLNKRSRKEKCNSYFNHAED